jgi:hypothetical protein
MTAHLDDVELFAALDGSLAADRMAHVKSCDACRRELDEARQFLGRVTAAGVPEPSPLFWDHFSRRVRQATLELPQPRHSSWAGWTSLAATAATVLFAAWLVGQPVSAPNGPGTVAPDSIASDTSEVAWESVLAASPEWADEDLFVMADDAMSFDDLSSEESAVFVRLLQEMEVRQ